MRNTTGTNEYRHEMVSANPDLAIHLRKFVNSTEDSLPHWHNSLEILHILRGSLIVVTNSHRFRLRDGDVIVINSRDVHASYCSEPNDAMLVQVPYPQLKLGIPDIDTVRFSCNTAAGVDKDAAVAIRDLLEKIYTCNEDKPDGYRLKTTSLVYYLLYCLYRHYRSERDVAMHKTEKYLERLGLVTNFIKCHYREQLSIRQMAEKAYLNPEYFSRFFKKYMGVTPLSYLASVRLKKVADDLLRSDHSITHLTLLHGCGNYKLFLRQFRSAYGCTPAQFRKNGKRMEL